MSTQPQTTDSAVEQRLDELEQRVEALAKQNQHLREENEELRQRVDEVEEEKAGLEARVDALAKRVDTNVDRTAELQSRELEKGAHLDAANVQGIEERLSVEDGRLERFTGDDGVRHIRLPNQADPLERSGSSALANGDLLPIQQLARMDDDMLRSAGPLPTRLAARVWRAREDGRLWEKGSGEVHQYLDASSLKTWIRRDQDGITEEYAKKLVSRTIGALQDLTKSRIGIEKRSHRKDGLQYKERRIIIKSDVEIPGEMNDQRDRSEE